MELVGYNVVVTANQFNPSIVSQIWLAKNGIVAEDEFESSCVYAEGLSQTHTKEFQLIVLPQMLQFSAKSNDEREGALVSEKVGALVKALPHTPYTAVGLNFLWTFLPTDETINALTQRLFFINRGHPPFLSLMFPMRGSARI